MAGASNADALIWGSPAMSTDYLGTAENDRPRALILKILSRALPPEISLRLRCNDGVFTAEDMPYSWVMYIRGLIHGVLWPGHGAWIPTAGHPPENAVDVKTEAGGTTHVRSNPSGVTDADQNRG
jgi:hypothetical protein